MHLIINPAFPLVVSVVSLWGQNELFSKGWVAEQRLDTADNVAAVKLQPLASYLKFVAVKGWGAGQHVNDLVQLGTITV